MMNIDPFLGGGGSYSGKGVHWGIQNGVHLSRSTIIYFKHNDMKSLESILENVTHDNRRAKKPRRYIIVEAVYQNSGEIAPLDEIIKAILLEFLEVLVEVELNIAKFISFRYWVAECVPIKYGDSTEQKQRSTGSIKGDLRVLEDIADHLDSSIVEATTQDNEEFAYILLCAYKRELPLIAFHVLLLDAAVAVNDRI
ncbi:UNVERIFIED_CONTAM: Long chain base biosynthesis protein 1b [Sesamum radiatum]|uniref:Long chain base biosynthesis protein 1b n=1 Tax=Sesamum radiatum TaxID=300843 RepID=A0AAW2KAY2_SESRA